MKSYDGPVRVGQVRPSQLLHNYGPGAMVDLPHMSVLVEGIDRWPAQGQLAGEVVEPRLLGAVRQVLGPSVAALRRPPHLPETPRPFDDWARVGVPVSTFPSWLRCPRCDRIGPAASALFELRHNAYRPDLSSFRHTNCQRSKGRAPPAVPVRFVLACPQGHLDDFPFVEYVHRGSPCSTPILTLFEPGRSAGADDVIVRCTSCNTSLPMVNAFGQAARHTLPQCRGRHPHLGLFTTQPCPDTARQRTLLLGASNSWFSVSLSAIAIPEHAAAVEAAVASHWAQLAGVTSLELLAYALTHVEALAGLSIHDTAAVWAAIEARRAAGDGASAKGIEDLYGPEWAHLAAPDQANGETAGFEDFQLAEVGVPEGLEALIERVVLVERMREVVALVGFTRVDPPELPEAGQPAAHMAPLSAGSPGWVPCAEVRGEGVFIQLREEAISAWEASVVASAPVVALQAAHQRWRVQHGQQPAQAGWRGARYVALHSLSHLLMRQMALECGYGSAALAERLYARDGAEPMAGILIYTAAPDSEGTLGGLVSLGRPGSLGRLLRQALDDSAVCASDPMCAEHRPSAQDISLHGAACHACLFAPEPSCERSNRYLDRSLLVETFCTAGVGLFAGKDG